jgi:hypothetical protein
MEGKGISSKMLFRKQRKKCGKIPEKPWKKTVVW